MRDLLSRLPRRGGGDLEKLSFRRLGGLWEKLSRLAPLRGGGERERLSRLGALLGGGDMEVLPRLAALWGGGDRETLSWRLRGAALIDEVFLRRTGLRGGDLESLTALALSGEGDVE